MRFNLETPEIVKRFATDCQIALHDPARAPHVADISNILGLRNVQILNYHVVTGSTERTEKRMGLTPRSAKEVILALTPVLEALYDLHDPHPSF